MRLLATAVCTAAAKVETKGLALLVPALPGFPSAKEIFGSAELSLLVLLLRVGNVVVPGY